MRKLLTAFLLWLVMAAFTLQSARASLPAECERSHPVAKRQRVSSAQTASHAAHAGQHHCHTKPLQAVRFIPEPDCEKCSDCAANVQPAATARPPERAGPATDAVLPPVAARFNSFIPDALLRPPRPAV